MPPWRSPRGGQDVEVNGKAVLRWVLAWAVLGRRKSSLLRRGLVSRFVSFREAEKCHLSDPLDFTFWVLAALGPRGGRSGTIYHGGLAPNYAVANA